MRSVTFFYITNRVGYTGKQIVRLANGRCNQENVIEQLKHGVNAMRMPVDDLLGDWAYMVMTSLAWNLKASFGLLLPDARRAAELIKMEYFALRVFRRAGLKAERETDLMQKFSSYTRPNFASCQKRGTR